MQKGCHTSITFSFVLEHPVETEKVRGRRGKKQILKALQDKKRTLDETEEQTASAEETEAQEELRLLIFFILKLTSAFLML